MRTNRFYVPGPLSAGTEAEIGGAAAHHAVHVLRLQPDDEIAVFNGGGGEFHARVLGCSRNVLHIRLGPHDPVERESPLPLVLVQAIVATEKMDYVIQKATELGVTRVLPVHAARGVVSLKGERAAKRRAHWQRVAIAACEQCGRNRLPDIAPPAELGHALASAAGAGIRLMLSPDAGERLTALPRPAGAVWIFVGPEGGWNEAELAAAGAGGCRPIAMGPRVLRTETAGPAALAVMQSLWGDF